MIKPVLFGAAILFAASAPATVAYTLRPADDATIAVTMSFVAKGKTTLKMPNWSPGAYIYGYPGKGVTGLTVAEGRSRAEVAKVGDNTWNFEARGPVTVSYSIPNGMVAGAYNVSGPSTYLYIEGRKDEAATLALDVPKEYKIAVGLDPISPLDDRRYKAPNYDTLADNPISMGDLVVDTYTVAGKPHFIALRGAAKGLVDRKRLLQVTEAITRAQGAFFGGLPYNRYVWQFGVYPGADGGGGLEHLSSTQISLASGVGPGTVGVLSHEFFHLWNVKRIRSAPLGPFDYDTLPQTGALWWLEGVTDYYGSTLLPRYGIWTKEQLYQEVADNVRSVRANPARLEVGANEASLRVRDANNGRGNSNGYRISYYNLGFVLGTIFDLEIIEASNGRNSLDSVELDLARRYARGPLPGGKRGFDESELRRLMAKYGGPSIARLYDDIVMKGGELPAEEALGHAGLELKAGENRTVGLPFSLAPGREGQLPLAVNTPADSPLMGKTIASINGKPVNGRGSLQAVTAGLAVGDEVRVEIVAADGSRSTVTVKAIERVRPTVTVVEMADATARQREVRARWMSARRSATRLPSGR